MVNKIEKTVCWASFFGSIVAVVVKELFFMTKSDHLMNLYKFLLGYVSDDFCRQAPGFFGITGNNAF